MTTTNMMPPPATGELADPFDRHGQLIARHTLHIITRQMCSVPGPLAGPDRLMNVHDLFRFAPAIVSPRFWCKACGQVARRIGVHDELKAMFNTEMVEAQPNVFVNEVARFAAENHDAIMAEYKGMEQAS